MKFQKGNTFGKGGARVGSGPKPSIKTQARDWIKDNPGAYEDLMDALLTKGINGDREAAQYVCDRLRGKPKSSTEIDLTGGEGIGIDSLVKLLEMIQQSRRIGEGNAERTSQNQLSEGIYEEEEGGSNV